MQKIHATDTAGTRTSDGGGGDKQPIGPMSWGNATEAEGTSECGDKRRVMLIQVTEAAGAQRLCDGCVFKPSLDVSMYRVNYYQATDASGTSDGGGGDKRRRRRGQATDAAGTSDGGGGDKRRMLLGGGVKQQRRHGTSDIS